MDNTEEQEYQGADGLTGEDIERIKENKEHIMDSVQVKLPLRYKLFNFLFSKKMLFIYGVAIGVLTHYLPLVV